LRVLLLQVGLHVDKLRRMYEHKFDDPNYGRVNESPVGMPWMRPGLAEELKRDPAIKEVCESSPLNVNTSNCLRSHLCLISWTGAQGRV